jgi:hypothetical protein
MRISSIGCQIISLRRQPNRPVPLYCFEGALRQKERSGSNPRMPRHLCTRFSPHFGEGIQRNKSQKTVDQR